MKKLTAHFAFLSFAASMLAAPLAFAGPSNPMGSFPPVKRGPSVPAPVKKAACCVTHKNCQDKTCCTTARHYFTPPSGRSLTWNELRDCTKTCTMSGAEQRTICAKGKRA